MRTHQDPLFRKVIAPWYDSEIACIAVIIFMLLRGDWGVGGPGPSSLSGVCLGTDPFDAHELFRNGVNLCPARRAKP